MTTYKMTTINSGTRIRADHNVFAAVVTSVNAAVQVTGSELWTAPADGSEVKAGDKWVKVTYNGFTGWMAYIHKGVAICNNFQTIADVPPVDPPPVPTEPVFPEWFTLTDPNGVKARYDFVRIVE